MPTEIDFDGNYGARAEEPSDQAFPEWFDDAFLEIKPISGYSIVFAGAELTLAERTELAELMQAGLRKIRSRVNSVDIYRHSGPST